MLSSNDGSSQRTLGGSNREQNICADDVSRRSIRLRSVATAKTETTTSKGVLYRLPLMLNCSSFSNKMAHRMSICRGVSVYEISKTMLR